MSNLISFVTRMDNTRVASKIYNFVLGKVNLPSDGEVFQLFKQAHNITDAYHRINQLFLDLLKEALLTGISSNNRRRFAGLLIIESNFDRLCASNDGFTLKFQSYCFKNPNSQAIQDFYYYLKQLDQRLTVTDATPELSCSIQVPTVVIEQIKEQVEEGIFESLVDSTCGISSTTIIELSFIEDLAKTNRNDEDNLNHIWQTLINYKPELINIKQYHPSFLILHSSEDDKE